MKNTRSTFNKGGEGEVLKENKKIGNKKNENGILKCKSVDREITCALFIYF